MTEKCQEFQDSLDNKDFLGHQDSIDHNGS